MIVVKESAIAQTIRYIPRNGNYVTAYITDENTNVQVQLLPVTFLGGDYFHTLNTIFPTFENRFYWLELKDINGETCLKERMFCTNQNVDTFSVNNGGYISNQTTNEFIMYE